MDQTLRRLDDTDVLMLISVTMGNERVGLKPEADSGLWLTLWRQQDPSILRAVHILGHVPLWSNLYRMTVGKRMTDIITSLSRFSDQLVDVSAINFNRELLITNGDDGADQVSFSRVILDFLQHSKEVIHLIEKAREGLRVWRVTQSDSVLFERARSLGFVDEMPHTLGLLVENESTKLMCFGVQRWVHAIRAFLQLLNFNGIGTAQDVTFVNYIETRLKLLEDCQLTLDQGWELLERSRWDVITGMSQMLKDLEVLQGHIMDMLNKPIVQQGVHFHSWQKLEVVKQLMNRGVQVKEAVDATHKLQQYCEAHQASLQALIPDEIAKLDRHFSGQADALILDLQKLGQQRSVDQKKDALLALDQMKTYFKALLPLLLLWIQGCGVKTTPVSEAIDYRPVLEFRNPPQERETDEKR